MDDDVASQDVRYVIRARQGEPVPVSKGLEEYMFLCELNKAKALRDACDLADECGQRCLSNWSVVWDSRCGASFFVPRSDGRRYSDLWGRMHCLSASLGIRR